MENPLVKLLPNHKFGIVVGENKEFYKWFSDESSIGLEITNQEYIYLYLDLCYINILDIIPSTGGRLRSVNLFTDLKINQIYV